MWTLEVGGEHFSPTGWEHAVTPGPTLSGKERKHPRSSRSNSTSPGLSASQADFKTGTASPPGLAATTPQRGSKSAPGAQLWEGAAPAPHRRLRAAAQDRGPRLASPPALAAETGHGPSASPAAAESWGGRGGREESGAGAHGAARDVPRTFLAASSPISLSKRWRAEQRGKKFLL